MTVGELAIREYSVPVKSMASENQNYRRLVIALEQIYTDHFIMKFTKVHQKVH